MNVYVQNVNRDVIRLLNNSGADISQNDFVVLGGFNAIAESDVANGEYGYFQVQEGREIQSMDLEPGENTFATLGQTVYYTPSDTFSDTPGVTYTKAGLLTQAKDANGMIIFDKFRYAEAVLSDET